MSFRFPHVLLRCLFVFLVPAHIGALASDASPFFIRFADSTQLTSETDSRIADFYVGGEMRRVLYVPPTAEPVLRPVLEDGSITLLPQKHLPAPEDNSLGLRICVQYAPDVNTSSAHKRVKYVFIPRTSIESNAPLSFTPLGQPEHNAYVWARQVTSVNMEMTTQPVLVPDNGRLDYAVALQNDWKVNSEAQVRFSIIAACETASETLYEEVIRLDRPWEPARWQTRSLDLAKFAGRETRFTFITASICDDIESQHAFPLWADPILHGTAEKEKAAPPNIVMIALDTLRADHLGCYGHNRNVSPNIDRLAEQSHLFENAIAPAPWTTPSFASVFTGRLPAVHEAGVYSKGFVLDAQYATLAEAARNAGMITAAFTEGVAVRAQLGFSRGFDLYSDGETPLSHTDGTAESTFRAAATWLEQYGHLPFLLFVHTYEPHDPYNAPEPWKLMFADEDYAGNVGGDPKGARTEADRQHLKDRYDGCIAYTDHWVGWFLERMKLLGLRDNTVIILFSDHGEEFWEHGNHGHISSVYDELLHVPLILSIPGMTDSLHRVKRQVGLTDLYATVLNVLGATVPPNVDSFNLLPLLEAPEKVSYSRRYVASELRLFDMGARSRDGNPIEWITRSLRGDDMKYIICDKTWQYNQIKNPEGEKQYEEELYNLNDDPGETMNLMGVLPEMAQQFRKAFVDFFAAFNIDVTSSAAPREDHSPRVDQDSIEALRALGYL